MFLLAKCDLSEDSNHIIDFGINRISCFGNVRNLAHILKYYVLKHFLVNATGMFHIDNYIET
jgi:hypothetical protein